MSTVSGLIEHAETAPDKPALIVDGIEISYRSLLARSAAIARLLRVSEVGVGDRVLYWTRNKRDFAVAFLGITGSGRVAVPVPDGAAPGSVRDLGTVSEATAIIVDDDLRPPSGVAGLRFSDCGDGSAFEAVPYEQVRGEFDGSGPADDAGALLLFTSGTTSKKKGVLLTHGNLTSATSHINEVMGIESTIREYVAIPLHHSFGLGRLRCVLQVGGTLVADNGPFDPAKLLHSMGRLRINALSSVPAGFALFMGPMESLLARFGGAIQVVEIGSAAMPAEHKEKLLHLLPNAKLFMHYGLTEASRTTFIELRRDREHWDTVGKPAPGVVVTIVDEHGGEVGPHHEGEIVVRGGHVVNGYFRDPERTRRASCTHGFRTGDFGFLDDGGFLHLRGRKDELINCGGVKISPLELEAKLQEVLGDVDFAVVGVRDPAGVAGKIPVVACVSTGEPLTLERLIERCSGVVDRYELPRAVLAVDEIPRTENGKVMRRALEQSIDPRLESEQVEARSALDRELMTIWQRGLGVSDVGVDDSFFGLGGNSLHAARLVNELRERLGEDVYINALFEAPTIGQLAEYLEKHHPRAVRGLMAQATPSGKNTNRAVAATEDRIESPTGGAAFRASLAQRRLWFIEQLRPGSSAYHLPEVLLIDGELDVAALRGSFAELVRRHESLRTTFGVVDEEVVQVVASGVEVDFAHERLVGDRHREIDAQRLLHDELDRPFDLERGPLFRARLLETGDRQHLLVYNMHHIISDGWSREILWRELSALYEAFAAGRPSPLPELPIQYSNFAAWQRQRLRGEVLETQLTYWRKQLAGLEALQLHTDHPRPAVQSFTGAVESLILPERTVREIRSLCTEQQVTLFMLLLAAFKALLHRYTGQDDIVVGSPVAGRIRKEVEELIGFFVNMLVLRTDLSGDPSGRELISLSRDAVLGAMRHQEMPFEKLVEALEPERDQSRNPLFQVTLQHFGRQQEMLSLNSASVRRPDVDLPTTRFDLEARILEGPAGIRLAVTYNTDLYGSATIKRMLTHFQTLLEGIVADPEAPVSRLSLLNAPERRQLVEKWSGAATEYPRDASIHGLFAEQAAATPDATALVFGDQQVTYAELDRRANQLAHHLQSLGVEHETLVGLCVERSVEMVVGILGILKAGGAYVPLDPSYPVSRLTLMLEDTQASLLLRQQGVADSLPDFDGTTVFLDSDWSAIAERPASAPTSEATADSLAYIIYTSGSTGVPKGVCVEQRSVVRLVRNTNYVELGPDEVFLQFAPISFDASTFELWGSLLNGARLVIFPPQVPSLEELGRVIEANGITTLWLTAALFKQMVDSHPESLAGVRQLLAGGEELSAPHVRRFLTTLADRRLINGYGPTENTTFTCCHVMTRESEIGRSVPIGRPISNTQVYVLDKNMEPVPVGVLGRLYTGGDGVARCYLNDAELTAAKFVPHPFSDDPRARLYDIGDQVRWLPDGTLEFLGRVDQQVKIRGFRIELGEIETALLQHPLVREAAVLCHGDAAGEKRMVAYVVPSEEPQPGDEDLSVTLRVSLAATLPGYMVPGGFALLEALPLTANGKLDRTALSAVECVEEGNKEAFVAPGTPTEQRVAKIWADLFEQSEISIHADFFRLGGHSLMAMRVISRLHNEFDVELPVQSLFSAPTVAGMAKAVDVLRWAATNSGDGAVDPDHEDFEI